MANQIHGFTIDDGKFILIIIMNLFISSCLEKLITKKERQMKLTRFIFSRRFEVIVTPLSSDKYLQVLEFK